MRDVGCVHEQDDCGQALHMYHVYRVHMDVYMCTVYTEERVYGETCVQEGGCVRGWG